MYLELSFQVEQALAYINGRIDARAETHTLVLRAMVAKARRSINRSAGQHLRRQGGR